MKLSDTEKLHHEAKKSNSLHTKTSGIPKKINDYFKENEPSPAKAVTQEVKKVEHHRVRSTLTGKNNRRDMNKPLPLILAPLEDEKSLNQNIGFLSFYDAMMDQKDKIKELNDNEMLNFHANKEYILKQLKFNKNQEKQIKDSDNKKLMQSSEGMASIIKSANKRNRSMPKIRVYPSSRDEKVYGSMSIYPDISMIAYSNYDESKRFSCQTSTTNKQTQLNFSQSAIYPLCNLSRYYFHWQTVPENGGWRPSVREGSSFLVEGKYGYLLGGISQNNVEDIAILDMTDWSWNHPTCSGDLPTAGRLGHTTNYYKGNIILFGGEKRYNSIIKIRECFNDLRVFNITTKEWKLIKCIGGMIDPRRNHIAAIIGKNLLIYGGINSHGTYLKDIASLNLANFKWNTCQVVNPDDMGLAFHTANLIVQPERRKEYRLYYFPELKASDKKINIKEEGLYVFGGKNEKDEVVNTLKILKVDQKPLRWIYPEVHGSPPSPRFLHTVVYHEYLNILVVYGGRNDKLTQVSSGNACFKDIHILSLDTLTWSEAQVSGIDRPRCSHVSGILGTKMIVFGGLDFQSYVSPDISLLELSSQVSLKLLKDDETNATQCRKSFSLNYYDENSQESIIPSMKKTGFKESEIISFLPIPRREELKYNEFVNEIPVAKKKFKISKKKSREHISKTPSKQM